MADVIVTLRRTARQSVHSVCRIGRVVLQHGRLGEPLCSGYQDRPMRYFSPSDLCHEGSYVIPIPNDLKSSTCLLALVVGVIGVSLGSESVKGTAVVVV